MYWKCMHRLFSLVMHSSSISTEFGSHVIDMLYFECIVGFCQYHVVQIVHVVPNCRYNVDMLG